MYHLSLHMECRSNQINTNMVKMSLSIWFWASMLMHTFSPPLKFDSNIFQCLLASFCCCCAILIIIACYGFRAFFELYLCSCGYEIFYLSLAYNISSLLFLIICHTHICYIPPRRIIRSTILLIWRRKKHLVKSKKYIKLNDGFSTCCMNLEQKKHKQKNNTA